MRALARTSYRVLVGLHPQQFRDEFGREMLWIFDQETQSEISGAKRVLLFARLLVDVLRSALIQHALRKQKPEALGMRFQTAPSGPMGRIADAGFIAVSCFFNVISMVGVLAALVTSRQ